MFIKGPKQPIISHNNRKLTFFLYTNAQVLYNNLLVWFSFIYLLDVI